MLALPAPFDEQLQPLLEVLPPDRALSDLVVNTPGDEEHLAIVEDLIDEHGWRSRQALCAGLYLYVDQLERSHRLSQHIEDATGSYWHAILHRREGDFSNSLYWLTRTGRHPAMGLVGRGYDAATLVRRVEEVARGRSPFDASLVDLQRREWATLFRWCAEHGR